MPDFTQIMHHEFTRSEIHNPVNGVIRTAACPHIKTDVRFKEQFADNHLGKIISYLTNLANNFKKVLIKKRPGLSLAAKIAEMLPLKCFHLIIKESIWTGSGVGEQTQTYCSVSKTHFWNFLNLITTTVWAAPRLRGSDIFLYWVIDLLEGAGTSGIF